MMFGKTCIAVLSPAAVIDALLVTIVSGFLFELDARGAGLLFAVVFAVSLLVLCLSVAFVTVERRGEEG